MSRLFDLVRAAHRSRSTRNVVYLMLVNVGNLGVALGTLPFITRALHPAVFGRYAIYLAVAQYASLLVDWGFAFAGSRAAALCRTDAPAVARLFWTIQYAKMGLFGLVAIGTICALLSVPILWGDRALFGAAMLTVISVVITPVWLFTGFERMELTCITLLTGRLISVPPILLFVHQPADAWIAALSNSLGLVLGGMVGLALMRRHRLVTAFVAPDWRQVWAAVRDGWHYFLSSASATLFAAATPIVLGLVAGSGQVGLFSAADRIRQIGLGLLPPFISAYYPRVSREMSLAPDEGVRTVRHMAVVLLAISSVAALTVVLFAPWIVAILMGPRFGAATLLLRVLVLQLPLASLDAVLGGLVLLPLGRKQAYSTTVVIAGITTLTLLGTLGGRLGANGAAIAIVATELVVLGRLFTITRPALQRPAVPA